MTDSNLAASSENNLIDKPSTVDKVLINIEPTSPLSDKTLHDSLQRDNEEINALGAGEETIEEDQMMQPSTVIADDHHRLNALTLSKMSPLQIKFFYFFEQPKSIWAKTFNYISVSLIFVSAIVVTCETLPTFLDNETESELAINVFPLETFTAICWTVELCGRFYASPEKLRFFLSKHLSDLILILDFANIIDFISILPFFVSLSKNSDAINVGRVLGVMRLLKVIKLTRYSIGIQLALKALIRSRDAIWMLILFLMLSMLFSATVMYWAERGSFDSSAKTWLRPDGSRSPFQSIPEGFYWSITTLATVGYGDVVPITPVGKFIASLTMLLSIMTIALPTSIIGSNFMAEWQIFQRQQLQKKMHKNRAKETTRGISQSEKRSEQNKLLNEQNSLMLQTIAEIQEKLSDINPPQYYQRYKELSRNYETALNDILSLEKEISKLKRVIGDLQSKQQHRIFDFGGSARESLSVPGLRGKLRKEKKRANTKSDDHLRIQIANLPSNQNNLLSSSYTFEHHDHQQPPVSSTTGDSSHGYRKGVSDIAKDMVKRAKRKLRVQTDILAPSVVDPTVRRRNSTSIFARGSVSAAVESKTAPVIEPVSQPQHGKLGDVVLQVMEQRQQPTSQLTLGHVRSKSWDGISSLASLDLSPDDHEGSTENHIFE